MRSAGKMTCWPRRSGRGALASRLIEIGTERRSVSDAHSNHQPLEYTVKRAALGILVVATLAVVAAVAGEDTGGWHEAKWGMTPDQVQKVLSSPTSAADLAKVCREPCNEAEALELDDYDLNGQHFTVRFWFGKPDSRLEGVSMHAKQVDHTDGKDVLMKIKSLLETSYGAPGASGMDRGHFVFLWTLPSTNITLYSDAANDITILYERRREKENGKP